MKDIGLFGDSFGDPGKNQFSKLHWSNLISQRLNANVVNYCESGSSQYFSYKKFLENHGKHEGIIFVVTDPHRYIMSIKDNTGNSSHYPCLAHLEQSKTLPENLKRNLTGWFVSSSDEFNVDMSNLMMEEIYRSRPSTLFIPSFHASLSDKIIKKFKLTRDINLFDLQKLQINLLGQEWDMFAQVDESSEILSGHLLPEFNEVIFNNIKHKIETGEWNWNVPKNITLNYKFEEVYYKRKNSKTIF
jgi:hypothetical protein